MNQNKHEEQNEKHSQIKEYLDQICGQVKVKEVHNDLREELK